MTDFETFSCDATIHSRGLGSALAELPIPDDDLSLVGKIKRHGQQLASLCNPETENLLPAAAGFETLSLEFGKFVESIENLTDSVGEESVQHLSIAKTHAEELQKLYSSASKHLMFVEKLTAQTLSRSPNASSNDWRDTMNRITHPHILPPKKWTPQTTELYGALSKNLFAKAEKYRLFVLSAAIDPSKPSSPSVFVHPGLDSSVDTTKFLSDRNKIVCLRRELYQVADGVDMHLDLASDLDERNEWQWVKTLTEKVEDLAREALGDGKERWDCW